MFQDSANGEMGRNDPPGGATGGAKLKVVGSRRKYRSRSTSASSQDSMSSGSYSGEPKDALITFLYFARQ